MKFTPAKKAATYVKLAIYGGAGAGKTIVGLSAPGKKFFLDTEGGSLNYASLTDFEVLHTQSFGEIKEAIDELADNPPKEETTLVIDSASIIWSGIQQAMLEKKMQKEGIRAMEGTEKVVFNQADWGVCKRWNKDIFNTLMALKCHVVCTFRENEIMDEVTFRKTGEYSAQWEKNSPYTFDFVGRISNRSLAFTKGRMAKDGRLVDMVGKRVSIPTIESGSDLPKVWEAIFGVRTEAPTMAHPQNNGEVKDVKSVEKNPESLKLGHKIHSNLLPLCGISFEDMSMYLLAKKDKNDNPIATKGDDGKLHLSDMKPEHLEWLIGILESDKVNQLKEKIQQMKEVK